MTVRMTVSVMNAATAILRPCDSLAAAMDGYSPERSGSDLLMQSAGLLIICHMREETTNLPTKIAHDRIRRGPLHRENPHDSFDCKNRQARGQIGRELRIAGRLSSTARLSSADRPAIRLTAHAGFAATDCVDARPSIFDAHGPSRFLDLWRS